MRVLLPLLLFISLTLTAAADDVLRLSNGCEIEGKVQTLVFKNGAKAERIGRQDLLSINLTQEMDEVAVKGAKKTGKVSSVRGVFKSEELVFHRVELVAIELDQSKPSNVQSEYQSRRQEAMSAMVPEALMELGEWCKTHGLEQEAQNHAQQCLDKDPLPETAARAHGILGHVLRNGEWVEPPPEVDEPTGMSSEVSPITEPAGATRAVTTAKESLLLAKKLGREYLDKNNAMREEEVQKAMSFFEKDLTRLKAENRTLKTQYETCVDKKLAIYDQIAAEKAKASALRNSERIGVLTRRYDEATQSATEAQRDLKRNEDELASFESNARAAKNRIIRASNGRLQRIFVVRNRFERLIGLGRIFKEDEMRAAFEKAIKDE